MFVRSFEWVKRANLLVSPIVQQGRVFGFTLRRRTNKKDRSDEIVWLRSIILKCGKQWALRGSNL